MSLNLLAAILSFATSFVSSPALAGASSEAPSRATAIASADGRWIYIGSKEDPYTGDILYGWRWSESDEIVWTFERIAPPILVG